MIEVVYVAITIAAILALAVAATCHERRDDHGS
jgi:hypothetical protein